MNNCVLNFPIQQNLRIAFDVGSILMSSLLTTENSENLVLIELIWKMEVGIINVEKGSISLEFKLSRMVTREIYLGRTSFSSFISVHRNRALHLETDTPGYDDDMTKQTSRYLSSSRRRPLNNLIINLFII